MENFRGELQQLCAMTCGRVESCGGWRLANDLRLELGDNSPCLDATIKKASLSRLMQGAIRWSFRYPVPRWSRRKAALWHVPSNEEEASCHRVCFKSGWRQATLLLVGFSPAPQEPHLNRNYSFGGMNGHRTERPATAVQKDLAASLALDNTS